MLKAIRMIIARKCVERKAPLVATNKEVQELTGKDLSAQVAEARELVAQGAIEWGETFNDFYYKLKDIEV